MASLSKSLGRSALCLARRGPIVTPIRPFSASRVSCAGKHPQPTPERQVRPHELPPAPEYSPDLLNKEERELYDAMPPEEREVFDAENRRLVEEFNDPQSRAKMFEHLDRQVSQVDNESTLEVKEPMPRTGFWADGEEDEFTQVEDADDNYDGEDMTSMAHAEVELHRELREYTRIAAWDMPLLSKLAQPFTLPPETHILRFRYTTYMGEQHPAEPKVVVELCSKDLTPKHLTEEQRQTFIKLTGSRYNPDTDVVRMSSEKYPARAQNKRYLGDLVNTLIKEAREGDSFADIPQDFRHHTPAKRTPAFPKSWILTEARKKQLEAIREERRPKGEDVLDGNSLVLQAARELPSLEGGPKPTPERVPVRPHRNPMRRAR